MRVVFYSSIGFYVFLLFFFFFLSLLRTLGDCFNIFGLFS